MAVMPAGHVSTGRAVCWWRKVVRHGKVEGSRANPSRWYRDEGMARQWVWECWKKDAHAPKDAKIGAIAVLNRRLQGKKGAAVLQLYRDSGESDSKNLFYETTCGTNESHRAANEISADMWHCE